MRISLAKRWVSRNPHQTVVWKPGVWKPGKDAAKLDESEKARLRKLALDWLRAELAIWTRIIDSGSAAERAGVHFQLKHLPEDSDLDGIRDAAALARLPAEERAACEKL